jgi:hypothetical protein
MRGRGRVDDKGGREGFPHHLRPSLCAKLQREGRNCGELRDRPAIAAPPRRSASPHDPPRCNGAPLRLRPAAAAPILRPRLAASPPRSRCSCAQLRPRPAASPPRCGRNPLPLRPAGQGNSASLGQGGGCNGDTATWPYIPPLRPCTGPVLC